MAAAQSNGALIDPDEHSTVETLASRHNVWHLSGQRAWEAKPSRRASANHFTATVFKRVAITVTVFPAHHSAPHCRSFGLWLMSGLNWARPPPSLPALERAALWSSPSRCAGLRRPVGRHARWLYDQSVSKDERFLSAAGDRCGCCRRHEYSRWPRPLSRHFVRRHINRPPQFGAVQHADVRSESAEYLRHRRYRNAVRLWPRR
jgi:hypothetical protein